MTLAGSHQVAISGRRGCGPRVRSKTWLCVCSYFVLAKNNSMEEVNLWEIMRIIVPENAQWVCIMLAAMTKPVWLTEE